MLTKEQLKEIEARPTPDVVALLKHIDELSKSICEHEWIYHFDLGFQCSKCKKRKSKL
jgi:hypothetical protein